MEGIYGKVVVEQGSLRFGGCGAVYDTMEGRQIDDREVE
jgi:hypothetical protein